MRSISEKYDDGENIDDLISNAASSGSPLNSYLMGFALKLTQSKEDAEDLLQDTLGKIFLYKNSYTLDTNFRARACTIMKHIFINATRKKTPKTIGFDDREDIINAYGHSTKYDRFENLTKDQIDTLRSILEPKLLTVFLMRHEGYKYNEISSELGMKEGTVKSNIFRARKILKETILSSNQE